jgi:hypothetical protein
MYGCGILGAVPNVRMQDVGNSPRCTEARYREMYQMYRFKLLRIKNVQMQDVGSNVRCTDERNLGAVPDVQI